MIAWWWLIPAFLGGSVITLFLIGMVSANDEDEPDAEMAQQEQAE